MIYLKLIIFVQAYEISINSWYDIMANTIASIFETHLLKQQRYTKVIS